MGKNILLTEGQFKQYVKITLLNERVDIAAIKQKIPQNQQPEITLEDLENRFNDWVENGTPYTLSQLGLDKFATGGCNNYRTDVPMTFEKINDDGGWTRKQLFNNAKSNLFGGKIENRMKAAGRGYVIRGEGETAAEHMAKFEKDPQKKKRILRRGKKEAEDAEFRNRLVSAIKNGDPQNRLPHSQYQLTPKDKREEGYLWLMETCKNNFKEDYVNENGEVYIPAKKNMKVINKEIMNINSRYYNDLDGYMKSLNSKELMDNLIPIDIQKMKWLNRLINNNILTPPSYEYVTFGNNIGSGVLFMYYVPEAGR